MNKLHPQRREPLVAKLNRKMICVSASGALLSGELRLAERWWVRQLDSLAVVWSVIIFCTSLVKFFTSKSSEDSCTARSALQTLLLLDYLPCINGLGKFYYGLVVATNGLALFWRLELSSEWRPRNSGQKSARNKAQICTSGQELVHAFYAGPWQPGKHYPCCNSHQRPPPEPHNEANWLREMRRVRNKRLFRRCDSLVEFDERRWRFIARRVYYGTLALVLTSLVADYFLFGECMLAIMSRYGAPPPQTGLIQRYLNLYGYLEQLYTVGQSCVLFVFANFFITMFYANLVFKARAIQRRLNRIYAHYVRKAHNLSNEQVYRQHLRLWGYFHHIHQQDEFVSKYSLITMTGLFFVSSFSWSYLSSEDFELKAGAIASILAYFAAFTYPYMIAWHIELQSTKFHKTILSIVARESSVHNEITWQKTFDFYQGSSRRTFSMNGLFPLNLEKYFELLIGLSTASIVTSRLLFARPSTLAPTDKSN